MLVTFNLSLKYLSSPYFIKKARDRFLGVEWNSQSGVTENMDFEVILSAAEWHFPDKRNVPNDTVTSRRGLGDIGFRIKYNLIGNKHERFGLAIMPTFLLPLKNAASEDIFVPGITLI